MLLCPREKIKEKTKELFKNEKKKIAQKKEQFSFLGKSFEMKKMRNLAFLKGKVTTDPSFIGSG